MVGHISLVHGTETVLILLMALLRAG